MARPSTGKTSLVGRQRTVRKNKKAKSPEIENNLARPIFSVFIQDQVFPENMWGLGTYLPTFGGWSPGVSTNYEVHKRLWVPNNRTME